MTELNYSSFGLQSQPLNDWLQLNIGAPWGDARDQLVAPFPPAELMQVVSGLTSARDFALHGVSIFDALQKASPYPIKSFKKVLDFGCGCGRLARIFKGYSGELVGCDIDERLVDWVQNNLYPMKAIQNFPNKPLPFLDNQFDLILSVSIFSHLNEESQHFYLEELARCTQSGGYLMLTIHGERAMERSIDEPKIFEMIAVTDNQLSYARKRMADNLYSFLVQEAGHLTTDDYKYGITFIPKNYLHKEWGKYFEIVDIVDGAIHDFQSIVVCRKK